MKLAVVNKWGESKMLDVRLLWLELFPGKVRGIIKSWLVNTNLQ